jgi:hypothetical protein
LIEDRDGIVGQHGDVGRVTRSQRGVEWLQRDRNGQHGPDPLPIICANVKR